MNNKFCFQIAASLLGRINDFALKYTVAALFFISFSLTLIESTGEFYLIPPHGKNLQWYESYERMLLLKGKVEMINELIDRQMKISRLVI